MLDIMGKMDITPHSLIFIHNLSCFATDLLILSAKGMFKQ